MGLPRYKKARPARAKAPAKHAYIKRMRIFGATEKDRHLPSVCQIMRGGGVHFKDIQSGPFS